MTRLIPIASLILVLAPSASGQEVEPKSDLERLQGTWIYVRTEGSVHPLGCAFQGNKVKTGILGGDWPKEWATVKLNPKKTSKSIDIYYKSNIGSMGIYKLEGNTLTTRFADRRWERPTKFEGPPGMTTYCWKRVSSKAADYP